MALTQTDLDALDRAIASAELEVRLEGRSVRYRSVDEMLRARQHLAEALQPPSQRRASYRYRFTTQRGD